MPDTVALSENMFDVALWKKIQDGRHLSKVKQKIDIIFDIIKAIVSILGFSCMPDIVVLSENIFDIALWVKNPRWPPFVQGQTIN